MLYIIEKVVAPLVESSNNDNVVSYVTQQHRIFDTKRVDAKTAVAGLYPYFLVYPRQIHHLTDVRVSRATYTCIFTLLLAACCVHLNSSSQTSMYSIEDYCSY